MVINWIKKNRLESLALLGVLLAASFFRFYNIPGYMTYLGDEGRDSLIVKRFLTEGDIPFIGPPTSVGNIYLGPLYYYMMVSPMAVFRLDPVGPVYMVAVIGVLTVFLTFFLSRQWFGKFPAVLISFLYAISPVTIIYSKSSWNPNPAPFFALIGLLGLYNLHKYKNGLWFILTASSLAFAVQMHYLALILIPIFGFIWGFELALIKKNNLKIKSFTKGTLFGLAAFLFLMSPLILFDLKHNFMNYRAITTLFSSSGTVGLDPLSMVEKLIGIYSQNLIGRYIAGGNIVITLIVSISVIIPLIYAARLAFKKRPLKWSYMALSIYLLVGVLGLTFYKQEIYDHYLGFLNPAPYLLLAAFISLLPYRKWQVKSAVIVLIIILAVVNLSKNPLKYPPNNQLQRTQEIAKFVISESKGRPFNFALLSQNNYDSAYQYYLDLYGHRPKQVPFDITDQLFVVCEDMVCHPTNNSKYEIAGWGMSKIEKVSQIDGVKVYKLIANPTGEPPE